MKYNVFDTQEEAEKAESEDYNRWVKDRSSAYIRDTKKWSEIRQRFDGKWVYPVCPLGIKTYNQEIFNHEWFVDEIEE
jgi:hypothetical protein